MRVTAVLATIVSSALSGNAMAEEGTLSMRGAYYKERATRVTQPMLDAEFQTTESGRVAAHFLIDSITSASVAAGATGEPFNETRYEAGGTYIHDFGDLRIGGGGRASIEPDYVSFFGVATGELDLAAKNATLGLAFAHGRDSINNDGLQSGMAERLTENLNTSLASLSFSQVLTPNAIASVTYDFTYLSGYQANLYRAVPAGGAFVPERVPDTRMRHALFASARNYFESSKTTAIVGYRIYQDDWGITGHTPELRVVQALSEGLELHGRYRFYKQSQAEFFKEVYDSSDPEFEPFLTADQKLANQRTQTFGAKAVSELSLFGVGGRFAAARLSVLFEYITQTTSFGNAIGGQLALAVPFEY